MFVSRDIGRGGGQYFVAKIFLSPSPVVNELGGNSIFRCHYIWTGLNSLRGGGRVGVERSVMTSEKYLEYGFKISQG